MTERVKLNHSEMRWIYRGRTDTWCLDLKWWKITVYRDKQGWKWLWLHSSDPYPTRKAAQKAAEEEAVRKFVGIRKRMEQLDLI